jgi:hypothetical protein
MMDDGSLVLEYSVNGIRQVVPHATQSEIMNALDQQKRANDIQTEIEATRAEKRRVRLHGDIQYGVNGQGHGLQFANRCVGPVKLQRAKGYKADQAVGADSSSIPGTADML